MDSLFGMARNSGLDIFLTYRNRTLDEQNFIQGAFKEDLFQWQKVEFDLNWMETL